MRNLLPIYLLLAIIISSSANALLSKDRWFMDPASAGKNSYNCSDIDNVDRDKYSCFTAPGCEISEGQTYWLCSSEKAIFECPAYGRDHSACFIQAVYQGTPPPSMIAEDIIDDGLYLKAKVRVMQTSSDAVIYVYYDRGGAFNARGYFSVKDVSSEKHGCYEIDMSGADGACSPVVKATNNIKGWHWTNYLNGIGTGADLKGAFVRTTASLWGIGPITIGADPFTAQIIFSNASANLSSSYIIINDTLYIQGVLRNGSLNPVVFGENVNVTGNMVVNGLASLGNVVLLANPFEPVSFTGPVNIAGSLAAGFVSSLTSSFTAFSSNSFTVNNDLRVSNDLVSDVDIRAGKLMGAVDLSACATPNRLRPSSDGGVKLVLGTC